MKIILGASGQVGSLVTANLLKAGQQVKAVVRSEKKGDKLKTLGATIAIADAQDLPSLIPAFADGDTLFALTPETGRESNLLGDTEELLDTYRKALAASPIKRVVGLSSIGAQYEEGTGILLMSYMLEHAFSGLPVHTTFVRPAYYFSNWIPYIAAAKETGILTTFYPIDLAIPMVAPQDVAELIASVIAHDNGKDEIYEIEGPFSYSSADVAEALSEVLGITIQAKQIPRDQWANKLQEQGFSKSGIENFMQMTDVVIAGKATPEKTSTKAVKGRTTLLQFMQYAATQPLNAAPKRVLRKRIAI